MQIAAFTEVGYDTGDGKSRDCSSRLHSRSYILLRANHVSEAGLLADTTDELQRRQVAAATARRVEEACQISISIG